MRRDVRSAAAQALLAREHRAVVKRSLNQLGKHLSGSPSPLLRIGRWPTGSVVKKVSGPTGENGLGGGGDANDEVGS